MNLIIGGYGEAKRAYAVEKYPDYEIWEDFHLYIKEECAKEKTKEEIISSIEQQLKGREERLVIISDEIGNGVVPMEKTDRYWRETTGRILTFLAGRASSVERIVCGIAVKIK